MTFCLQLYGVTSKLLAELAVGGCFSVPFPAAERLQPTQSLTADDHARRHLSVSITPYI